jgi:hypothetical protein
MNIPQQEVAALREKISQLSTDVATLRAVVYNSPGNTGPTHAAVDRLADQIKEQQSALAEFRSEIASIPTRIAQHLVGKAVTPANFSEVIEAVIDQVTTEITHGEKTINERIERTAVQASASAEKAAAVAVLPARASLNFLTGAAYAWAHGSE